MGNIPNHLIYTTGVCAEMSEVEANTPVQTPTAGKDLQLEEVLPPPVEEPAKPLLPPNPLPLPKRALDEAGEDEADAKRPKIDGDDLLKPTTDADGKPLPPHLIFDAPAPRPPAEPDMDNLPSDPMPPHQAKFAVNALKLVKRLRDALPFLHPVDIIKLNIPYYYNYIPRPMDISTIEKKINANAYHDVDELIADFNLMVANCKKFNGELLSISKMATNIQAAFEKHMLNFPPREGAAVSVAPKRKLVADLEEFKREARELVAAHRPKRTIVPPKPKELPYDVRPRKKKFAAELRFCSQTIKELMLKKHERDNMFFLSPVDVEALNIPHYFDVVKEPMDLGTIQLKLANNQYDNGDDFERDVRLVFTNCYAFNPDGNPVNEAGKRLEAVFERRWAQKPVLEPTPPGLDYYLEDDDEFDARAERLLQEVPAIQLLENQLKRMKADLDKLKEEHLKQLREEFNAKRAARRGKRLKKGKRRSPADDAAAGPVVTFEMKKQVLEMVPSLLDKKLQQVIKIIRDDVEIGDDDEVELDMDQLEDHTVLKLHNYLFGQKAALKMLKKKAVKTGGLLADDELLHLRSQLALFDGELLMAPNGLMNIGHDNDSLDDDDVSSELSEEE